MAGIHSDRLRAAKALISKPEAWTQHSDARDAQRRKVSVRSPAAVCFCGYGALIRVTPRNAMKSYQTSLYLNRLVPRSGYAL